MPDLPTDLFDYELPERLIAQTPSARRDGSRLMVVDRASGQVSHRHFSDLPSLLGPTDILFRNVASVLPARLHALRPSGGRVECFLLRPEDGDQVWRCLVKPGRRLAVGATFSPPGGEFKGEILAKAGDGSATVRFTTADGATIVEVAKRIGEIPLPPYIARDTPQEGQLQADRERYQTVYADPSRTVAVAAPTAGLHFTPELLAQAAARGVRTADVTLHVGLGTFKPMAAATVAEHVIHRELYEVPRRTQELLFPPLSGRRIAVGTTTVRSVEHFLKGHDAPTAETWVDEADLFVYPPALFRGVDAMVTNFHQPRSTLMCLVSAFLAPGSTNGIAWIKELYAEAIRNEYRFFSYGDAMFIQ